MTSLSSTMSKLTLGASTDSWVPIIEYAFKMAEKYKKYSLAPDDSLEILEIDCIKHPLYRSNLQKVDRVLQKVFQECPKEDCEVDQWSSASIFWKASTKQLFVIPNTIFPTIRIEGGWKTGTLSFAFGSDRKTELVWASVDCESCKSTGEPEEKGLPTRDFGEFKEAMLTKLYGDTGYWPKVHFSFRTKIPCRDTDTYIETRYLFSQPYSCSFNMARQIFSFSPEAMILVIHQVSAALKFLHNVNLIHGDVKSDNILIGKSGATLCDFDYLFDQTKEKPGFIIYGQPEFGSPELVSDYTAVTDFKPSDAYALGMSLFEGITIMNEKESWCPAITRYYRIKYHDDSFSLRS